MNLLNAETISKSYSDKALFKNINLGIDEGDKIGIIGVNGTGKSTLLRIIGGFEDPDEGRVVKGNSVRVEYLPQNQYFDDDITVLDGVFKGNSPVMKLIREYEEALKDPDTSNEKLMRLTHEMDTKGAWSIESEGKAMLTRLGILDFDAKVNTMSGGQRKRIALASALINPCELLIMDEPTNHLDNDTIDYLEQYLNKRKGALLMVTHDRYFLDRIANVIVELDGGNLYTYKGNYTTFLEKKAEREELEAANDRKRQNIYRRELAWIKRGAKARSTKQKARIERFENLKENLVHDSTETLDIALGSSRLGKKVIELSHIEKSFDNKKVIDDFSYIILRNDRVGIIGPNGSGKTTLFNIISSLIKPDMGSVEIGETVKISLFSQETGHMDDNLRVIDYIKEAAEVLTTKDGDKISASQMLERFLFPSYLQWSPISKLSGGERRRLYLLRVLMETPNVLLLDEPTNDLDIKTLTILEDYLESFPGAVMAISHDRYFLDRMAEKIFVFEGDGSIKQHTGNFSDFKEDTIDKNEDSSNNQDKIIKNENRADDSQKKDWKNKKDRPLKFSFKEKKEYEEIDGTISQIEDRISELEKAIEDASSDYTRLQELLSEKEEAEKQLEEKMERWVYLNELAEKING